MTNKQRNYLVFGIFALLFFLKNLVFHWFSFYEWLPAGETGFLATLAWLLPKIGSAIFFASLTFLVKDKRWLVIPAFVIDIWCLANWIYMRNNNFLLDSFAFNIVGNLNGYWWSCIVFVELLLDISIFVSSILVCILVFRTIHKTECQWAAAAIVLLVSVVCLYASEGLFILSKDKDQRPSFRWDIATREGRERVYGIDYEYLVSETSLLSMPLFLIPDYLQIRSGKVYNRDMMPEDLSLAQTRRKPKSEVNHSDKLIIVICESLENWLVRPDIMPHLSAITQLDHVLYANNVKTQIVGAPSADGQMIINTGLLPLTEGYTCFRYPLHDYPSLMRMTTDSTVMLLPHDTSVWNQAKMSIAYGYDTTIIYSDVDTALFNKLNEIQQSGVNHIQCITQSTHAPFVICSQSQLKETKKMPIFMDRFIRAFNVLDEGLGLFVDRIATDSTLREYTIVITADHHILYHEKREKYQKYCDLNGLDYTPISPALPLIIYSPKIEGNIHISEPVYQMDIYPTVLHLLGGDDYEWQGFGINLLDSTALTQPRIIDEGTAFHVSDLIIRNNWFAH